MNLLVRVSTAVVLVAGCSSSYVIDAGPEAEVTYDSLVRVDSSKVENFWAKPDVDFTRYTRILLADPVFEFRTPNRSSDPQGSTEEFPLSEQDKRSLVETVGRIFLEELENNRYFTLTDSPGPEVLILDCRLLDFVALVPRRREPYDPSDADVHFSSVGEVTLVIEAHDSTSGEILVRAVERRAAGSAFEGIHTSRKNGWAEIRPVARHWAELIRERLDQIHDAGTLF